jgi:hypothetical protein
MGLLDRLGTELRSAGKAAQGALDEGKIRLEIFRVRQLADRAAQALGYAVHRAKKDGRDLDPDTLTRLQATLAEHEREAERLEAELAKNRTSGAGSTEAQG